MLCWILINGARLIMIGQPDFSAARSAAKTSQMPVSGLPTNHPRVCLVPLVRQYADTNANAIWHVEETYAPCSIGDQCVHNTRET